MTPYTIYEEATGRIMACGRGLEQDARAHVQAGQALLLAGSDWKTQYVDEGEVVNFPASPGETHEWDWGSKSWVYKGLADLQAQRWEDMKASRQAAVEAPLVTPYGTFDADAESRAYIIDSAHLMQTEAQTLAPGSQPTDDFTLADNSVVTLTAGQMVEVALLLAAQIKAAFARGREVRAAIAAATTPDAVLAITWSPP